MAGTWTCSEDEDFGSLGDNKVIVTGGTSGSPCAFSDFVTADRAGEAVLKAATNGAKTMTLAYQIRPVEDLALLISFIVAAKTTETDYIFITGTDFAGNAQTESIDVSAGNATYVSTSYFATITQIDCEDAGDGTGTAWADGTIRVTQPRWGFIWDYGNSCQYQISSDEWDIGDDALSTYFGSKLESAYFSGSGTQIRVRGNAHLILGEESNSWGVDGSFWNLGPTATMYLADVATSDINLYASWLHLRDTGAYVLFRRESIFKAKNSILSSTYTTGYTQEYFFLNLRAAGTGELEDVYTYKTRFGVYCAVPLDVGENIHTHECGSGVYSNAAGVQIINAKITTPTFLGHVLTAANGSTLELIDPIDFPASPTIVNNNADNWAQETYTCNVKVVDHEGTALAGVVIDCTEAGGTAVWTAGTISTDANGDIAEQEIPYRRWSGTSETLTSYSPHKFTIYKPGYETLIMEAVTVDDPIVWHLEMQPLRAKVYGRSHRIQASQFL